MGQPKKKTTRRRTGNRRSHHFAKLAREVNKTSPVRVVRMAPTPQPKLVAKRATRRGNK